MVKNQILKMDDFSLKNLVDEIHVLNKTTFASESLIRPPLPSNNIFAKNINFEYDTIRAAPHGGSLAVLHSSFTQNLTKTITIYDPLLNFHRNIIISESIQDFYFTADEMIVVVFNKPSIGVYDQRGKLIINKDLSEQQEFILTSAFWENGIMIATFAGNVYLVYDFSKLIITKFANNEDYIPNITSALVLPPKEGEHGPILWGVMPTTKSDLTKLVFVQKNRVKAIDYDDQIINTEYSSDFSMVMVLTPTSVDICDEYFRSTLAKISLPNCNIYRACWCGSSTVLLTTSDGLKMVGQSENAISYAIPSSCFAIKEIDGARVVTSTQITYIREVSGVPLQFIQNKTESPSLKLFNIVSHQKDFATSDPLESLRNVMDKAINGLLDAATFFRNPTFVKKLLYIVMRYKDECNNYNSERYQNVLTYNRIISQLNEKPSNMPLTVKQLLEIGNERLLIRLCNRYLHFLAFRVSDYLNVGSELVSSHWAHCLIFSRASNDEIMIKLNKIDSAIDRVELAASSFDLAERSDDAAFKSQKENLAIRLLKTVPSKSRTVPLLIQRNEWSEAVEAAVESNDSSLLAFVLKSATEQHQDSLVRDCITKHLIALDGWLKMHPDEPQKAELLEKSGLLRDSLFLRFKEGQNIEQLAQKAKESNDALDLDYFTQIATLRNACNQFGVDYDDSLTAYDIFDKIIEKGDQSITKQAAKLLKLQSDEIITRKIHVAEKTGNNELIQDAAKEASQHDLYYAFLNLLDDGKLDLAMTIKEHIKKDDIYTPLIEKRLADEKY